MRITIREMVTLCCITHCLDLIVCLISLEITIVNGKSVGVLGAGRIGKIFINILLAIGCKVLCFDPVQDADLKAMQNVQYVDMDQLLSESDIISMHLPLSEATYHLINYATIMKMKTGVILLNTSRGGLVDTKALINGLKSKKIGGAALDVYEGEQNFPFKDWEDLGIQDDTLARLLTFKNVIFTSHQVKMYSN